MAVKSVTIEGENVIVAASDFDRLCMVERRCLQLEQVVMQAREVVKWDWSDNDEECVADIDLLRKTLDEV